MRNGRTGTKATPDARPALEQGLSWVQSRSFQSLGIGAAFMSPSGLGQDTTTEENNHLNPRLSSSQRLFQKNGSSREERFVWLQMAERLPASPLALV